MVKSIKVTEVKTKLFLSFFSSLLLLCLRHEHMTESVWGHSMQVVDACKTGERGGEAWGG